MECCNLHETDAEEGDVSEKVVEDALWVLSSVHSQFGTVMAESTSFVPNDQ